MACGHGTAPANGIEPADNDSRLLHGIDAGGPFLGAARVPSLVHMTNEATEITRSRRRGREFFCGPEQVDIARGIPAAGFAYISTRTTSCVTFADFLNIAVAEQYFSSDSETARSTSARFSFRPRTV